MTEIIAEQYNDLHGFGMVKLLKQMKFGTEFLYPNNNTAIMFCKLLKQTTITRKNCKAIIEIGFKVTISSGDIEVLG